MPELDVIGPQVVRAISTHDDRSHARALALIDELLEIGQPGPFDALSTDADSEPASSQPAVAAQDCGQR